MNAFEEFIKKQQFALLEYSNISRESIIAMQKIGWKGCIEWILSKQVNIDGYSKPFIYPSEVEEELNSEIKTHHPDFNPKNNLASMPEKYLGQFYNACSEPCDMLQGPCACGAWHHQEEWPDEIQLEVFGNVSSKKTILKRKPINRIKKDG